jgi:UDP-glucose 4,6-dehydratase
MAAAGDVRILVYGKGGFVGNLISDELSKRGLTYKMGDSRIQNRNDVEREIDEFKPTHVINAAGVTGRPNVDWCEDHQQETIRSNVLGALTLADVCFLRNLHVTNWSTGCIYTYDEKYPEGYAVKETDPPNFAGSFYSKTKGILEELIKSYPNVATLRLRMPISDDLNPRSLITKITQYPKIVGHIKNSMSVMHDLVPISIDLTLRELKGIWNFTNPGAITHNEILAMYKQYINPEFKWENFNLEEQAKVIKAPRSNTELDASKLKEAFPELLDIHTSLQGVFQRMKVNLGK